MVNLENKLKDLILKNVEFKLDDKVIRRGKIKVFNTKQFFIKFKIEADDNTKDYELPYPYKVIKTDKGYTFDYCLSAFCPRTEEVYWKMKTLNKTESSKIHENYLHIVTLTNLDL